MSKTLNKLFTLLKENKKLRYGLIILLILLILLLYFSSLSSGSKKKEPEIIDTVDYTAATQQKLADTIAGIKGVGKVKVMIRFESSSEIIIAYITSVSGSGQTTSPQILSQQGSQLPLILKTVYPKALSAIVVAEGANDVKVRLKIQEAVVTALGVPNGEVNVFAM